MFALKNFFTNFRSTKPNFAGLDPSFPPNMLNSLYTSCGRVYIGTKCCKSFKLLWQSQIYSKSLLSWIKFCKKWILESWGRKWRNGGAKTFQFNFFSSSAFFDIFLCRNFLFLFLYFIFFVFCVLFTFTKMMVVRCAKKITSISSSSGYKRRQQDVCTGPCVSDECNVENYFSLTKVSFRRHNSSLCRCRFNIIKIYFHACRRYKEKFCRQWCWLAGCISEK